MPTLQFINVTQINIKPSQVPVFLYKKITCNDCWRVQFQESEKVHREALEGCASRRFCEGDLQRDRSCRPPALAHIRPQRCVSHRDVQPGRRDQPEAEEGDVGRLHISEEYLLPFPFLSCVSTFTLWLPRLSSPLCG